MTSYPKLDELVQNLEESSDRMSDLIGVIETIKDLKNRQDELLQEFKGAADEVKKASYQLTVSRQSILATVDKLARSAEQVETTAEEATQHIRDALAKLRDKVDIKLKAVEDTLTTQLKTVDDTLTTGLDGIKRENRQHYSDLETLVRLKLDENKADIKQFIEHERGQIATLIDTRSQAVEGFIVAKTDEKITQLVKNQQSMQTTLWVLGVLLVVVLAKLFDLF